LTKYTEDKQCTKLVFITRIYRGVRSTKHKIQIYLTARDAHHEGSYI